ncbi:hypothetical protein NDU88_000605 [Pleurodeles waltl]|uniref:Uncharacterized protein n=1 Tax=Pleurodeles waltl TaxID=8319 RepID=A0AAV7KR66_PLEWA|nr:hypothetical protein NDU88_000605 [Pleurodeles waltl]
MPATGTLGDFTKSENSPLDIRKARCLPKLDLTEQCPSCAAINSNDRSGTTRVGFEYAALRPAQVNAVRRGSGYWLSETHTPVVAFCLAGGELVQGLQADGLFTVPKSVYSPVLWLSARRSVACFRAPHRVRNAVCHRMALRAFLQAPQRAQPTCSK